MPVLNHRTSIKKGSQSASAAFQFSAHFLHRHASGAQLFAQRFAMKAFDFLKQCAGRDLQRDDARLHARSHHTARIVFKIFVDDLLRQRAPFDLRLGAFDLALDLFEDVAERIGVVHVTSIAIGTTH